MRLPDPRSSDTAYRVGICVYAAEQWTRLREVISDAEDLEETHEEWLAMLKQHLHRFREAGIRYELLEIDVEELVKWCKRKRLPINSAARAEYASFLLHRRSKH